MKSPPSSRLLIVSPKRGYSDSADFFDPENGLPLYRNKEGEVDGFSKFFRFAGGDYAKMAAVDYSICEVSSGIPFLRVFRARHVIGSPPPFELFDGKGALLAQFGRCFSVKGDKWRFTDGKKNPLFDMSVKQQGGFVLSVKSLGYDLLIDDEPFASVTPHKETGPARHDGKRVRLLEFVSTPGKEDVRRLLLLGVAASLDKVVQHKHG